MPLIQTDKPIYYINTSSLTWPVTESDIRAAFPNVSFPFPFVQPEDYAAVFPAPLPEYNSVTQTIVEGTPQLTAIGHWEQTWVVQDLDAETVAANQAASTQAKVAEIVAAMESLFDATAQSRQYDNRITCALRAGYAGPFQAEGLAFATWMDRQNAIAYQMLAQVQAGTMAMPSTPDDALSLLEPMVWP